MNSITNINIKNKRILIRVDYNVPIDNGKIINDFRIKASFKTIEYCLSQNCSIILMSHLGRPKNKEKELSLFPVFNYLEKYFSNNYIYFSNDCINNNSIKTSKDIL